MCVRMCVTVKVKDARYLLAGFDSNDMKYSCILDQELLLFQAERLRAEVRGWIGSKVINIL